MSTSDLLTSATHIFLLAEQSFRLWWCSPQLFWKRWMPSAPDPTAHLPAMAAVVRETCCADVLLELARHPLPGVLPPEAVPWHASLVEAWEVQRARASDDWVLQNAARLALVRLDGCGMPDGMERPSRLPEWLAEARQIANGAWRMAGTGAESTRTYEKLRALAALAAWRPAPGVSANPETLRDWGAFWQQVRRSSLPMKKALATKALLNLSEANLRAASLQPYGRVPYGRVPNPPLLLLLRDLAAAIRVATERTAWSLSCDYLLMLDWQPGEKTALPAAGLAEVAQSWLEAARHRNWQCHQTAWGQLIRWEQTGGLTAGGIDLLPFLLETVESRWIEKWQWEMLRWIPTAKLITKPRDGLAPVLLQKLETHWQRKRALGDWESRMLGWTGGICLHQSGLATESPEAFLNAYLSAVAQENEGRGLFGFAQWSPGINDPADIHRSWQQVWRQRMKHKDTDVYDAAGFAFMCQALEKGTGERLRRLALEAWRTGTKEVDEVTNFLKRLAFRFHDVRAGLAIGSIPDFRDYRTPPAKSQCPRLTLPPGHIADRELKMENEKLKMKNHEGALTPGNRPAPDGPSR